MLLFRRKKSSGLRIPQIKGRIIRKESQEEMSSIPEKDGALAYKLLAHQERMTWDRFGQHALENASKNESHTKEGDSIVALHNHPPGEGDTAIVIAAGPSLKRKNPPEVIKKNNYKGAVVVTESAMRYCLQEGVIPDLVVTVDPDESRVVRWFGDPTLTDDKIAADDYFRRQDQDDAFNDEIRANEEILKLLKKYGNQMRIALSTTSSPNVVKRAFDVGMEVYWWNPMLDNPDEEGSVSQKLQDSNGFPCINAGGNVGSACWMIAGAALRKSKVALTGVDFSYYDDTPLLNTQYYREIVDLVGEKNVDALYARFLNPHLNAWFFTDPAYLWYREALLEMVIDAEWQTFNCTEGGIVFGEGIEFLPLADFLNTHA